jgi:uncharacterized protein (DUF302 family)
LGFAGIENRQSTGIGDVMLRAVVAVWIAVSFCGVSSANDLIEVKSPRSVNETVNRLEGLVKDAGFVVVARVPHSAAALAEGLTLRPTELLIFGRAQGGTPIMVCDQRAGIDLPLRAVAWQDEQGQVWLAMNDPKKALKQRYALPSACDPVIEMMDGGIRKFLAGATSP